MPGRRRPFALVLVPFTLGLLASVGIGLPALPAARAEAPRPAASEPDPAPGRYRYVCISLGSAFSPSKAAEKATEKLNEMADRGWRLTESAIENGLACFEKGVR